MPQNEGIYEFLPGLSKGVMLFAHDPSDRSGDISKGGKRLYRPPPTAGPRLGAHCSTSPCRDRSSCAPRATNSPDLLASLDGQIHVDLIGRVDAVKARIRNTFEGVPDAPVSSFVLEMQGGKKGLLVNNTEFCKAAPGVTAPPLKSTRSGPGQSSASPSGSRSITRSS